MPRALVSISACITAIEQYAASDAYLGDDSRQVHEARRRLGGKQLVRRQPLETGLALERAFALLARAHAETLAQGSLALPATCLHRLAAVA